MGVGIVEFHAEPGALPGMMIVTVKQVTDERGTITELFRASAFEQAGIVLDPFRQINVTHSWRGALRGLHGERMNKLVAVVAGEALGAYVDLRPESPRFCEVATVLLRPGTQVLVPAGVANGFQALTDPCLYAYCFDSEWQPAMAGVSCNPLDPALGIEWPIPIDVHDRAQISAKDLGAPSLADAAHTSERES